MSSQEQEHTYEVDIDWAEGRIGIMSSPVLDDRLEVATPPQFPEGVPGIWSPEHLFVSSVSGCFMTTFVAIAENSGLAFEDLKVNAVGTMGKSDGKFMITEIMLKPELLIYDEKNREKALRILEKAEAACLITRSIKSEVKFEPNIAIAAMS